MSQAAQLPALFGSQNMQSIAPNYNLSVRAEAGNCHHRSRDLIASCLDQKKKGEAAVAPIGHGKKLCCGSTADIGFSPVDVRFTPKSGHC
jgi:hypothetical protein